MNTLLLCQQLLLVGHFVFAGFVPVAQVGQQRGLLLQLLAQRLYVGGDLALLRNQRRAQAGVLLQLLPGLQLLLGRLPMGA